MSSATVPAPLDTKPLSETERVVDTFVAPSKTFTDIRRNANWWVPWVLMTLIGLIWVYEVDKKIGMEKVAENQVALSPKTAAKLDQLPPDQRASQMEVSTKLTRIIAYVYPLVSLIVTAILAGILMATFNFGFGAELKFKQCYAVSMYAFLPSVLKVLISMLIVAVGAGESFTFQNPVASNLGGLVDRSSTFLFSIATSIDIFTIWTLILTGIGYFCLTKLKRGTCMGVVFGWWALVVLVSAGFAALFA